MGDGEIVVRGAPEDLVNTIKGRVWRNVMEKEEAEKFVNQPGFLNKRQKLGRTEVSILSDDSPANGFTKAEVNLEDAYFAFLNRHVKLGGTANAA